VALQDCFVETDGFTRLPTATRIDRVGAQHPGRERITAQREGGPTIGDLSINKTSMSRMEKSVSLTPLGGSGTLVGFEPSNTAGATFRTLVGRFGRTIGTSRATEVYSMTPADPPDRV
jgi:hypothetical protein